MFVGLLSCRALLRAPELLNQVDAAGRKVRGSLYPDSIRF